MSRNNRPAVGLQRVLKAAARQDAKGKIIVVVGTVTDDIRLVDFSKKITLAALRVTAGARRRIEAAGGEIITFDQLALRAPTGTDTILIRGHLKGRKVYAYFDGKPYTRAKGRKFERAALHKKVKRNKRELKKK